MPAPDPGLALTADWHGGDHASVSSGWTKVFH